MTKKNEDIIAGVILLVVSVIVFIFSNRIPRMVVTTVGPDFMPKLVALGMAIFSCLLIFKSLQIPTMSSEQNGERVHEYNSFADFLRTHIDLVTIALLFLYAIGIATLGFLISTIIYLVVHINLMGMNKKQNLVVSLVVSIGIAFGVYLLFTKVLYVMLPSGFLG